MQPVFTAVFGCGLILVRALQYLWFRMIRLGWRSWLKLTPLMLLTLVLISTFVTPIPDQQYHFPDENTANSNFHVVEFSDEGQPHDLKQQQALFERIKKPDSATAELIIFVHG